MTTPAPTKIIRTLALIDDDDDDDFFMRRTLKKAGIGTRVIRLHNGKDAIDYFARTGRHANPAESPPADLAFLDINMPGLTGFQVLAWLKEHQPADRPFIAMLSTSNLADDKQKAAQLGADCYLEKPPTPVNLQEFARAHAMEWAPLAS